MKNYLKTENLKSPGYLSKVLMQQVYKQDVHYQQRRDLAVAVAVAFVTFVAVFVAVFVSVDSH